MSILTNLLSGGAAKLVESVGGVIDNLHTSKEEKLEAEATSLKMINRGSSAQGTITSFFNK